MTSSSPGGALPARHSSFKTHTTHTHQEMASINTHTHSGWGNNQHRRGYTRTHAHPRKWATSTAGCRSVCKHKHTQAHTAKHSYKPEITLSVHVNLTPNPLHHDKWILIAGHREFQSPPPERLSQPGGHHATGLGELDGQERAVGHRW